MPLISFSVKSIKFEEKLQIRTSFHTFLELRCPKGTIALLSHGLTICCTINMLAGKREYSSCLKTGTIFSQKKKKKTTLRA